MDDAAISRAQNVLVAKGLRATTAAVREALAAAENDALVAGSGAVRSSQELNATIQVSGGMVAAGRVAWIAAPSSSVHVLLPMIYKAMERQRQLEEQAASVEAVAAQPIEETPTWR